MLVILLMPLIAHTQLKAHPGFNYGKYLVSFADSALIKGKEYKTPYMDIDGGYTRVGFVKAIHAW